MIPTMVPGSGGFGMREVVRRRTATVASMAVALLLAACGSTVAGARAAPLGGASAGMPAELGAGATTDETLADGSSAPASVDVAGATGPGATGSAAPRPSGARVATGAAAGPAGAASAPAADPGSGATASGGGASAQGVTDTAIKVGLAYDKNAGALNTAFGFAGIGQIDQRKAYEAIIDHINKTGGVGGRKLEPVYFVSDQLSGKTAEQNAQEACATWTQDNKVFATFSTGTTTLISCLNKAGVVQVGSSAGLLTSQDLAKFPLVVEIGVPATDSLGRFVVEDLVAQGFYREGRAPATTLAPLKYGLVAYDSPAFKAGAATMKAALAENGLKLSEEVYIARAETPDDIAREANDIRAAALRFKERGITHVQFLQTNNAFLGLTFFQSADKLDYRPRYGLTSADGAQALIGTLDAGGDGTSRRQFEKAVGMGHLPLRDVPVADYTGDAESPELRKCKEVLASAADGGFSDGARNKESIAAYVCDTAFYFKAAVEAGGPVVNTTSWKAGVSKITQMGSATTFLLRTEKQRDAPGAVRSFGYFTDCSCFHYTGPTRRV